MVTIGVLAFQGSIDEHIYMLQKIGVNPIRVKKPSQLKEIDGLIIPGGESTSIGHFITDEVKILLRDMVTKGFPIMGTCAGLILLAKDVKDAVVGYTGQKTLELLNVSVIRNAFGRQRESFEAPIFITFLNDYFNGVFIRAPVIEKVNSGEIIAKLGEKIVGVLDKNVLGLAFHPELTEDTRIHEFFVNLVKR